MLLGFTSHVILQYIKTESCLSAYWQSMSQQLNMVKAKRGDTTDHWLGYAVCSVQPASHTHF